MKTPRIWIIGAAASLFAGCAQQPAPTGGAGAYVTLTVRSGQTVLGAQAAVTYDPGQLDYVGVRAEGAGSTAVGHAAGGRLNLAVLDPGGASGPLVSVTFREKVRGAAIAVTSLRGVAPDGHELSLPLGAAPLQPLGGSPDVVDALGEARKAEQTPRLSALAVPVPTTLDPAFVNFPLGDFNQDGNLTISDAVSIDQVATGQNTAATPYQKYTSDLSSNGQVGAIDAVIALQKLVNPNLEAQLAAAPQQLSLAAGQSATILIANAGNGALPTVTRSLPANVTLTDVSGTGSQGSAYRLTVGSGGASGVVAFLGGAAGNDVVQLNTAQTSGVASVAVSGPTSLKLNAPVQFSAVARDAGGGTVSGQTFTWSSSNPSVATVDAGGNVTAKHFGSVTISATAGGIKGSAAPARTYGLEAFGGVRDNGYDTAFYLRYRTSTGTVPAQDPVTIVLSGPSGWNNNQPVVFNKPSYFFDPDGSGGHWFELDWVGTAVTPLLGTYTVKMTVDGQDWTSSFAITKLTSSVTQPPTITVTGHTSTSATASWNAVAPGGSYMTEVFGFYPPEHVNTLSHTIGGLTLTPGSTYYYAVTALSLDVTVPVTTPLSGQFDVRFNTQGFVN